MEVADDGRILSLQSGTARPVRLANGGAYLMEPLALSAFQQGEEKKFSLEDDILPSLFDQARRLYGVEKSGPFIDIGIPEDHHRTAEVLPE